ncbi:MAG: UDP-N-acetylglucosamine 1-carboxyvinyltransferase [Microthrixaceae bacterium]
MSRYLVHKSGPLQGEVQISGAKNSALKLMAACLLAEGTHTLANVPDIADVTLMTGVLEATGLTVTPTRDDGRTTLSIERGPEVRPEAPYELVEKMRASTAVLGPLLATVGEARVAMPGGDDFGARPIDMHLAGLEALGARFELSHGDIIGTTDGLVGAEIALEYPSVGATENLLMAAVLAKGSTTIINAAREPEIADLASLLNRMGGAVVGAGTSRIDIEGVEELRAVSHSVVPDRLEVGTFLAALGVAGGEVTLHGTRADNLEMLVDRMGAMGLRISPEGDSLWAMSRSRPHATDVATLPYPGLATDFLPVLVSVLCLAEGTSYATENVFAGRFGYVGELARMGARVRVEDHHLVIDGVETLSGAPVRAPDIRAGAALVVAGLGAEGTTEIRDGYHIDRGYERLDEKLSALGAPVERVES